MYKLMICDDEALERTALRKIIERRYSNITVLEDAKTGDEAIQKVRLYLPDILLIDIKMPEKNGIDAQKKILEFHPNIKTVIITAYSDFTFAHEAIKYHIEDFLLKPVPPSILYECIDKILGQFSSKPTGLRAATDKSSTIQNAIAYIEAHYLDNLRLADVASSVFMSEKYFSRFFKKHTGQSFTDYTNRLLISRAKSLLLQTTEPIYKIAMDLHFSDAAYFSKVFKKYEEVTPLEFRKCRSVRPGKSSS